MRKLSLAAVIGLLGNVCHAACDSTTPPTVTTRLGLSEPVINACGWGTTTINNWGIVDSSVVLQVGNNSFTGTNSFSGTDSFITGSELHFNSSNNSNWGIIINPTISVSALEFNANRGVAVNAIPLDAGIGNPGFQIFKAQNQSYGSFAVMGSSADASVAYSGFQATSPITQSTLWSLPKKDGSVNQCLATDGSAHLSFITPAGGGGGSGAGVLAGTGSLYQTPYVSVNSSNTLQMSGDLMQYPSSAAVTVPLFV